MILENGLIRTMDAQVPRQRALAIAGERIAGGVGVHETALASPEVICTPEPSSINAVCEPSVPSMNTFR